MVAVVILTEGNEGNGEDWFGEFREMREGWVLFFHGKL